jgi:hypothetical protein
MSLAHGRVVDYQDGQLTLGFPNESAFHRSTVSGNGKSIIEKTLSELFQLPIRLTIVEASGPVTGSANGPVMSLAEEEAHARVSREKSAEQKLRAHPAVRSALQILGGQIEHIQVLDKPSPTTSVSEATPDSAEDGV